MPREKPILIFDGDCSFCRQWIARWQATSEGEVDFAPYQEVASEFPQIPIEKFRESVQLVVPDGNVSQGAEAVFRTLDYSGKKRLGYWMYRYVPGFKAASEWMYQLVAQNRPFFSSLTRLLWGRDTRPARFSLSTWIFPKALGAIYAIAFASLAVQITGLIGSNGILPANLFFKSVAAKIGFERFLFLPSIFWFNASDAFFQVAAWTGAALAILLVIGILEGPILFLLWFLYLSFYNIGGDFLGFQWDILLLETGFLAIFLAPLATWGLGGLRIRAPYEPSHLILWLFRWLLFRLVFFSGIVKLLSGDVSWHNLTALQYHYETQPLPTWIGWYFHWLPAAFHQVSAVAMFLVEILIPFFIFGPRRLKLIAFWAFLGLQTLIFLTGNYCFFNLLTLALSLFLIDDRSWPALSLRQKKSSPYLWPKPVAVILTLLILTLSSIQFAQLFRIPIRWPVSILYLYRWTSPFQITNAYGLFAVMTTTRNEIIIEGSRDGQNWQTYEFTYKPGDVTKKPAFVEPHQPRLDWQMWFAALSSYKNNPWFMNFCIRLLQGSPEVLKLVKTNPFPDRPPQYIRGELYEYHFSSPEMRKKDGVWWTREYKGSYSPVMSLQEK